LRNTPTSKLFTTWNDLMTEMIWAGAGCQDFFRLSRFHCSHCVPLQFSPKLIIPHFHNQGYLFKPSLFLFSFIFVFVFPFWPQRKTSLIAKRGTQPKGTKPNGGRNLPPNDTQPRQPVAPSNSNSTMEQKAK